MNHIKRFVCLMHFGGKRGVELDGQSSRQESTKGVFKQC